MKEILPVPTGERKIRHQPWYKERLKTKYIKSLKPKDISKTLIGKNWVLLKKGLDDFRDGLPPVTDGNFFIQHKDVLGSNLIKTAQDGSTGLKELSRKPPRFTKDQICYSRKFPLAEERWNRLELLEYSLLQHPLALFPHLEKCVEPEVFLDIVKITDPEIFCSASPNLSPNNASTTPEQRSHLPDINKPPRIVIESEPFNDYSPTAKSQSALEKETHSDAKKDEELDSNAEERLIPRFDSVGQITKDGTVIRNPYRWLAKTQEKKDKKRKDRKPDLQDDHVRKVTKEFSEWVSSLGGENNIDEVTIINLFTNNYENKPPLSVPIEIVDPSNDPQDLHLTSGIYQQPEELIGNTASNKDTRPPWKMSYQKCLEGTQFGALSNPTEIWKQDKMKNSKELDDGQQWSEKKMNLALNSKLSFCSRAFVAWVEKKGYRKPEFLKEFCVTQKQNKTKEESDKDGNGKIAKSRSAAKSNIAKYSKSQTSNDLSENKKVM